MATFMIIWCCEDATITKGGVLIQTKLKVKEFEELQKREGLSDTELAELMGVNRSQIWRVKRGFNAPGGNFIAGTLKAFANATFADLFYLGEGKIVNLESEKGNSNGGLLNEVKSSSV